MIQALKTLGAFDQVDSETGKIKFGAGWAQVKHQGKVLILSDEDAQKLKDDRQINDNEQLTGEVDIGYTEIDANNSQHGNLAIISSGSIGTYEMHKREILAFLMRGVDVLAFNIRGYGESEGTPSKERLKEDFSAVYDYAHQKGYNDSQILLKTISMTAGPAAHLVKKHPKVNIFMDQGYSSFQPVVKAYAKQYIEEYVNNKKSDNPEAFKNKLLDWFANHNDTLTRFIAWIVAPNWRTSKYLTHPKGTERGKIGMLVTREDEHAPKTRHADRIQRRLSKRDRSMKVYEMDGTHGSSWIQNRDVNIPNLKEVEPPDIKIKNIELEQVEVANILKVDFFQAQAVRENLQQIINDLENTSSYYAIKREIDEKIASIEEDKKNDVHDLLMKKIISRNPKLFFYYYLKEQLPELEKALKGKVSNSNETYDIPKFNEEFQKYFKLLDDDGKREIVDYIKNNLQLDLDTENERLSFNISSQGKNSIDDFLTSCNMLHPLFIEDEISST